MNVGVQFEPIGESITIEEVLGGQEKKAYDFLHANQKLLEEGIDLTLRQDALQTELRRALGLDVSEIARRIYQDAAEVQKKKAAVAASRAALQTQSKGKK
jgi:hypothetical protein